jgi:tetratricopeptide (TPR) repeat protein
VNQCRRRLEPDATTLEVVELISNYLHQQLLTGTYQITASSPAETLRSGDYNCLSATILFQAVCQRLALPAQAMGTTGHVYSRVGTELPIDVETTLPEWRQSTMRQQSVTARELTDVQLLAKVYYNRGVRLLQERDYREALQSAWHSCQLDPADTVARRNLLASINNWALELCEENEYQAASSLLSHGRQLDASYRPFDTNDMYLHGRWMTHLRRIGEYDQALDIVKRAIERWPDVPYFLQQQAAIARQMGDRVATGK